VQGQCGAKQNDWRHHQDRCNFQTADYCPKEKYMDNSIKHAIDQYAGGVVLMKEKLEICFVEGVFSTSREGRYLAVDIQKKQHKGLRFELYRP
jgi:hypothetical protein